MKIHFIHNALLLALTVLCFFVSREASAQSTDAEFKALIKTGQLKEAETLARNRHAKNSKDDIALWYLATLSANDAKTREEMMVRVEQCIKDMPQSARCQNALGRLYGAAAMSAGMISGIKYASSIKTAFIRAVELDPRFFEARHDLNRFYLNAPGIAGGSVRKALENADTFAQINQGLGALLRAEVHIYEKEFERAETILESLIASNDAAVVEALPAAWAGLGLSLINHDQSPKALKLFERLIGRYMNDAFIHMGLGRAQFENKLVDAAIASFEHAQRLNDKRVNVFYRLGIAYQTKGDKLKALSSFQQFLLAQPSGKAADDARKRIEVLKSS